MAESQIPKTYEPQEYEDAIYKKWEESGLFNPDVCVAKGITEPKAKPFSMVLPPPNVTGTLHMGHALTLAIEDILVRFKRMQGYKTLWLPGTDHAAIATQSKVEKEIYQKEKKNRYDLGREELLRRVEIFAKESRDTITNQVKKMGCSLDWSREAYTLDAKRELAVRTAFKTMYDDGLIYRGHRIVNWDPKGQTTISDDEIVYVEEKTTFYYFKYGPFVIGTARPETKFGDKYVVMHPDDKRYAKYKSGQKIKLEWINGPIEATIIKDESIDMSFGTGVMTITPWHSAVDFEIAERHKLDKEQIIDKYGKLLPIAGEFAGMKLAEARPKIVEKLRAKGLVVKEEDGYSHNVATAERTNGIIEPQIMNQWFVDVNKKFRRHSEQVSLKDLMKGAIKKDVKILPERFEKVYLHWIENLRDWCISRQIWYGHRVPVWYKNQEINKSKNQENNKEEVHVGVEAPKNPNFIFLHGFYRTREVKDPLNWLNKQLPHENNFWQILPNADKPNRDEQEKYVLDNAKINKDSVIVAHSLGCVLALKIIQDHNIKIKKLVLMSPSFGAHRDEMKKYKDFKYDFKKIKKNVVEIIVFQPGQDHVTKPEENAEVAEALGAKMIKVTNSASHFNSDECQEILDELKKDCWTQDEDTLDTWFSSGLWTFSTLGWPASVKTTAGKPEKTGDLALYHPTSVLETGYDIIFFWVARMILMSTYLLDEVPFKTVYLHGMVRNADGSKMSKSKGAIDPLEMSAKYGTDALRMSFVVGNGPGNDMKMSEDKIAGFRNFANKLWNIARYILGSSPEGKSLESVSNEANRTLISGRRTLAEKWILSRLNTTIQEVTERLENFDFSQAGEKLRAFTWDEFADWYLEINKIEPNPQLLAKSLESLLLLWHPFMPFVTEEIWSLITSELGANKNEFLMVAKWPEGEKKLIDKKAEQDFSLIKDIITSIRNARAEFNIPPANKLKIVVKSGKSDKLIKDNIETIKWLARLETVEFGAKPEKSVSLIQGGVELYLVLGELVDLAKEKTRIKAEIAQLEKYIKNLGERLSNKEFVKKAPKEIVDAEKAKLEEAKAKVEKMNKQLGGL